LYLKNCSGDYFSRAFNASSLHQTRQTRHHSDGLTLYYTPHQNSYWLLASIATVAPPKRLTQSAFSNQMFAAYNDDFEQIIEIIPI